MNANTLKIRFDEMKRQIAFHDYNYYVLDKPQISDFEYDKLYSEYLEIETTHPDWTSPDSPSQRITGKVLSGFNKIQHRIPMISLANTYSPGDLIDFDNREKKLLNTSDEIEYFVEPKYDGLAIELIYENGFLTGGSTRGDGIFGEDVFENLKTIRSIPLSLNKDKIETPSLLEVRGEILIYKKDFILLNQKQDEMGIATFANPRNAASGTIRQLDTKITASRPLRFIAHGIGATEGFTTRSQFEMLTKFSDLGLPIAPSQLYKICISIDEVIKFYHFVHELRIELPFEIDGIVVKVNSIELQKQLGFIAKSPRWASAAKYEPERAQTQILDIVIQVGRTGVLTPVAIMKPLKVGGVTITNATLHNFEEVQRKDIRVGDSVWVQRAGDVIPEVIEVIMDKRPEFTQPFQMPDICPACGAHVDKSEEEVAYRCINLFCSAVLKESIKHFISRKALNVEKVGDKLVDELVDQGLVLTYSDLYKLSKDQLLKLDRKADKSVDNILRSLEKSKSTDLAHFIYGLGIRFVGEQTAKTLAAHFQSIDLFLNSNEETLVSLNDVGPKVARSIVTAISRPAFKAEITELLRCGVHIQPSPPASNGGPLSGKSFLITGTLDIPRNEAEQIIQSKGGKLVSSVSKKLSFLVVGENPGSKLEKANKLSIPVLSWQELKSLLNT